MLLDIKLQEILSSQEIYPSILKNTKELLDAINTFKESDTWKQLAIDNPLDRRLRKNQIHLVTFDVVSLYTNIDLELLYEDMESLGLEKETRYICDNNYFQYANEVYRQTNGIAMGTNAAVNLANYFLAKRLDPFFQTKLAGRGLLYKRFIDDLFLLFFGTEEELQNILHTANNIIPGISLTMNHSTTSVDYLDITLSLEYTNSMQFRTLLPGAPYERLFTIDIAYRTFQKELNKYIYITPHSAHTFSMLRGFVIGELKRYRLTNSTTSTFNSIRRLFRLRLLDRGYSHSIIGKWFSFEQSLHEQQEYVTVKPPGEPKTILPFVLRFTGSPRNKFYSATISQALQDPTIFKTIRETTDIRRVFSTSDNAATLLLRSGLSQQQIALLNPEAN
jgi:hypothetical protein